jgi:predicted RecB family nuclease
MESLITSETALASTNCPRKASLLASTPDPGLPHEYDLILGSRGEANRDRYIERLKQSGSKVEPFRADILRKGYQTIVGAQLESGDLRASCDILVRVERRSTLGKHSYLPTIIVGTYSITEEQRFTLAFAGYLLGKLQGEPPDTGTIVTLDDVSHKVNLKEFYKKVEKVLVDLRGSGDKVPPVILNRHCPHCHFRDECRSQAERDDDLSLLDRMTPKAIRRFQKKGIFTVNQLSYLFKQRRSRKRSKPNTVFKLELQALAIRTGKTYLQAIPEVTREPKSIFLDIEGIPDEQFHYLIGVLICEGQSRTQHSFWADAFMDESNIWERLRSVLNEHPDAPIYHYGGYERRALTRMGRLNSTDVEPFLRRMHNLNEIVYGRVYFPVRSNSLKVIGKYLGATWTEPDASGLQSLVWRYRWEGSHDEESRAKLEVYNLEDCNALQLLWEKLLRVRESAESDVQVDFAERPKRFATETGNRIHAKFEEILESAHLDYKKKRLCVRSGKDDSQLEQKKKRGGQEGHRAYLRICPTKADRVLIVPRKRTCPKDKGKSLEAMDEFVEKYQIDLELTKRGCLKRIVKYRGRVAYCPECHRRFDPPEITRLRDRQFGHGFQSWSVYQRIALRLPFRVITSVMEDLFNERASAGCIVNFMRYLADYYKPCEDRALEAILGSPFVHVDETKVSIQGVNNYVWIFTDGLHIVFRLTESRETDVVRGLLSGYRGVLVSDFYPGYDGIPCKQQKCLVHLIRDLNDDLWDSPFNGEFEGFVLAVKELFTPMIEAVDRYGLKRWHLAKFKRNVDDFYRRVIDNRTYQFEVTRTYQRRFERYKDSLFLFLDEDGIPWNNNMAERGLRHLAVQRLISGSFFKDGLLNYLLLLGICQTCRFQNKSFFRFLMSRELDVDSFKSGRRLQATKPNPKII